MLVRLTVKRAAFLFFAVLFILPGILPGQTQFRIPLIIHDNTPKRDTLIFGVHPLASYCIDGATLRFGDCDTIVESELPPTPPTGVFDVRYVDSRSGGGACMGVGMAENIQGYVSAGDVDTFQLKFQPGAGGYPFTFRWPAVLSTFADSIILRDLLGLPPQFGGIHVNMTSIDSAVVTNNVINGLYIFLYHPKTVSYPAVPTPTAPSDGAVDVDTMATFTWTASAGATSYIFQVSESPSFSSFFHRETLATTTKDLQLAANKTYYWRVSATHPFLRGCFSQTASFTTVITRPDPPTLVSPAQGASGEGLSPTLIWNTVPTATSYHLQVSPNQSFTVFDYIDSTLTDTVQQVGPFPNCVTRYWRVSAKGPSGTSFWSEVRNFTVTLAVPGAPSLVSPADGAGGLSTTLTLSWTGTDSCSRTYRLEVSTDSLFTSPLVFDNLTAQSRLIGPLAELTDHWWRVRASNQGPTPGPYSPVRKFTTLLNPPAAPTLFEPDDGDTTVPAIATLRWLTSTHADSYMVQLASNPGFTAIIAQATTTDTLYQTPALANCNTYHWRVAGINASGPGSYSGARSFRVVRAIPTSPVLLTPTDGEVEVDEFTTLTWEAEQCAFQYRVELAKDAGFTNMVTDQTVNTTSLDVGPLDGNTDHFWRVSGINNLGTGTPSVVFTFKTTALTTPPPPVPLSPLNGQGNLALPVTLCWDSAARATSYHLQVSIDSVFNVITYDDSLSAPTLCKEFSFLLNNTTYYWRVNGKNSAGTSAFSQVFRFTTLSPPVAPTLISPVNGADEVTVAPVFYWSVPQNAVSYELQIAHDSLFTSIFSDDSSIVNTSWQGGPFQSRSRYYWRVRAKNSVGIGPFSPVFTFRTTFIGVANWLMPLAVRETGPARDTIYLGLHPDAACSIDPWLGEFELPPPPFPGTFDARFISLSGGSCSIGEGLRVNLLPFVTYTQVDTYRVRFQPGTGTYPITLSWSREFIQTVCDSMVIKDEFGGSTVYARMDRQSSVEVTNSGISSLLIVKHGAFPLINDVKPPPPEVPGGYMLSQNYPNPFNPSTRITFTSEHHAYVRIVVFDVLGREVSLLADGQYFPGIYTLEWDGRNDAGAPMPSGVYYVHMAALSDEPDGSAGNAFTETRKMMMLK